MNEEEKAQKEPKSAQEILSLFRESLNDTSVVISERLEKKLLPLVKEAVYSTHSNTTMNVLDILEQKERLLAELQTSFFGNWFLHRAKKRLLKKQNSLPKKVEEFNEGEN